MRLPGPPLASSFVHMVLSYTQRSLVTGEPAPLVSPPWARTRPLASTAVAWPLTRGPTATLGLQAGSVKAWQATKKAADLAPGN